MKIIDRVRTGSEKSVRAFADNKYQNLCRIVELWKNTKTWIRAAECFEITVANPGLRIIDANINPTVA